MVDSTFVARGLTEHTLGTADGRDNANLDPRLDLTRLTGGDVTPLYRSPPQKTENKTGD